MIHLVWWLRNRSRKLLQIKNYGIFSKKEKMLKIRQYVNQHPAKTIVAILAVWFAIKVNWIVEHKDKSWLSGASSVTSIAVPPILSPVSALSVVPPASSVNLNTVITDNSIITRLVQSLSHWWSFDIFARDIWTLDKQWQNSLIWEMKKRGLLYMTIRNIWVFDKVSMHELTKIAFSNENQFSDEDVWIVLRVLREKWVTPDQMQSVIPEDKEGYYILRKHRKIYCKREIRVNLSLTVYLLTQEY